MVKDDVAPEVFARGGPPAAGVVARGDRRGARRRALADRLRARRDRPARRARERRATRSRRRSTAPPSCSSTATSGCARRASTRSCACAPRSSAPAASTSTGAASSLLRRADPHARGVRGHDARSSRSTTSASRRILTQSGQLYGEAGAMALGKVYCFGPTFRAEKSKTRRHLTEFWMIEPEVAFADLDDDMEPGGGLPRARRRSASSRGARAELQPARARHRRARARAQAVPAHHLRRGDRAAARRRASRSSGATTSAATRRPRSRSEFDRPVMVHRYPAACKAFYMKGDPADPRLALCVDVLAPEGYGEIIGGGQREDDLADARGADRRARPAARGVRLVPRPAPLRLGAARRLRHGHRALRRLDVRAAPRARDDPVPAHARAVASVNGPR